MRVQGWLVAVAVLLGAGSPAVGRLPAPPLPLRVGAVSDYTGSLDPATRDWLAELAGHLEGVDLAVAILPAAGEAGPRRAAHGLAESWRLGRGFPGGGVLVAFYLAERSVQVIPRGRAAHRLNADTAHAIGRLVIAPYCRQERLGEGAVAGCYSIARSLGRDPVALTGRPGPLLEKPDSRVFLHDAARIVAIAAALPLAAVALALLLAGQVRQMHRRRRWERRVL